MASPLTRADLLYLREAIVLAERGRHAVEPNPLVGCVVVRGGKVVGRGWHEAYGGPHAEVVALRSAGRRARGATVYVSLEPCTTHGKTPPCLEALVAAGVTRVAWASRDPDPRHGGKAKKALEAAGIEARGPMLPTEGDQALSSFRRALSLDRPWVVLKWASSLDGRVAPAHGTGGRISGVEAQAWLHDLRGRVDAICVGVETVIVDDPLLTCRAPTGPTLKVQPAAVVFDTSLRTPIDARLVRESSPARPLFLVSGSRAATPRGRRLARHVGVFPLGYRAGPDGRPDAAAALRDLRLLGFRRILVEGGPTLAGALLSRGLVDQVAVVLAPTLLGGDGSPTALHGTPFDDLDTAPRLEHVHARRLGDDLLVEGSVNVREARVARRRAASPRTKPGRAQRG